MRSQSPNQVIGVAAHETGHIAGGHLARTGLHLERSVPAAAQRRLYVWALERGGLDAMLDAALVRPFVWTFERFDRIERRWVERIAGRFP